MNDILDLKPEELEFAQTHITGLIDTLKLRKGIGQKGGLLSEEESILNSLLHPERGDLIITLFRDGRNLQLYVSNPRDPSNPLAVMNSTESKRHTGRRLMNANVILTDETKYALFLITTQDRDLLKVEKQNRLDFYSISFGLGETPIQTASQAMDDLKSKPLEKCTFAEKWEIYKKNWEFDFRLPEIEHELFGFSVMYAKYKQPAREETIILSPEKYKENLGQLFRDIYPPNVRIVLMKDYQNDHRKKVEEQHEMLRGLVYKIEDKKSPDGHEDYMKFLKELGDYMSKLIQFEIK